MGFEATSDYKKTTYIKVKSKYAVPDDRKSPIIGKYFETSERTSDGTWVNKKLLDKNGNPLVLYAYLKEIKYKADNFIEVNGQKQPKPLVQFVLVDDADNNYQLDMDFITQKKSVQPMLFSILNSFYGHVKDNKPFGYLKFYFYVSDNEKDPKKKNIALYVRNAANWVANSKNYGVYKEENTKFDWGYKITEIPKAFETDEEGNEINKTKKQQTFFIEMINKINDYLKQFHNQYSIDKNSIPQYTSSAPSVDDEDDDDDIHGAYSNSASFVPPSTFEENTTKPLEDDDLPF